MKYSNTFGQTALCLALGATGLGEVEARSVSSPRPSSPSTSAMIAPATILFLGAAASNSSAEEGDQKQYIAPSVIALGNHIAVPGNLPSVKACFQSLSIEEKPLQQLLATDAQKVVDCADQKAINTFLKDPSIRENRLVPASILRHHNYVKTANAFEDNADFAIATANKCKQGGPVTLDAFKACAYDIDMAQETKKGFILAGGMLGGSILLAGLLTNFTYRKTKNNGGLKLLK